MIWLLTVPAFFAGATFGVLFMGIVGGTIISILISADDKDVIDAVLRPSAFAGGIAGVVFAVWSILGMRP